MGVGVVDEDDAVVGEVGCGDLEAQALVLVAVVAVVEVDADGGAVLALEVGPVVHVVEGVRGARVLAEAATEVLARTAEVAEVVDADADPVGVARHAGQEREAVPDADVHERVVRRHLGHGAIDHRRDGERRHARDPARCLERVPGTVLVGREAGVEHVEGNPAFRGDGVQSRQLLRRRKRVRLQHGEPDARHERSVVHGRLPVAA
jgi:hypothetical protein